MISLPSFLTTFPFTLPSLPSISLPANIQRRFLSYVLKRTLGRIVSHQALDAERIQAQISEGWVELENLEIDCSEINSFIPPSVPLALVSGTLNKLTAKVPFPNLWSDPLQVSLDTLTLHFTLSKPSPVSRKKAPERRHEVHDLADSVTSAADDFLHHELDAYEEKELEGSIRQSLIFSQSDPSVSDVPGGFPLGDPGHSSLGNPSPDNVESTTVLEGMVERILARLEFRVDNVRILIRVDGEGVVELSVGKIRYADEKDVKGNEDGRVTTRAIRVSNVSVTIGLAHPPSPPSPQQSRTSSYSSSSSSASSTSTYSGQGYNDMFMSQAVVDLRQSMAEIDHAEASVYAGQSDTSVYQSTMFHSAISQPEEETSIGKSNKGADGQEPRSATPMPENKSAQRQGTTFLRFGQEDIVFRMRTTQPPPPDVTEPVSARWSMPSMELEITMGVLAVVVLPNQLKLLITAAHYLSAAKQDSVPVEPPQGNVNQPQLTVITRLNGFYVTAVYDLSAPLSLHLHDHLDAYFSKPNTYLPFGHLRMKAEGGEARYVSQGYAGKSTPTKSSRLGSTLSRKRSSGQARFGLPLPSLTISISEVAVLEHLDNEDGGEVFPVLLFDPGLALQYDVPSLRSQSARVFPEFEASDWRAPKRGGSGEKQWKVRVRGKGILKGDGKGKGEGPMVLVKQDVGGDSAAVVHLQPIHVFLDLSMIERLLPLLRSITPLIQPPEPTPSWQKQFPSSRTEDLTPESIIHSLSAPLKTTKPKKTKVDLHFAVVRLSVRCPEPPPEGTDREACREGSRLRSGILSVDVHGIKMRLLDNVPMLVSRGGTTNETVKVEFERTLVFFAAPGQRLADAFFVLSSLPPDFDDNIPLLPSVSLAAVSLSPLAVTSTLSTTLVSIRLPSIQASIYRPTVIGLQYFADDMTRWLDGAFVDGSSKPRDELKLIGSRFFGGGSKGSEASSEDDETFEVEEGGAGTRVEVDVDEVNVGLHVPKLKEEEGDRTLRVRVNDMKLGLEGRPAKNETVVTLTIMELDFSDVSLAAPVRMLGRTTPFTLTSHQAPMLHLRFVSSTDSSSAMKQSDISLWLSHFTLAVHKQVDWVHELAEFAKSPPGVFENLSPTDLTRLSISLSSASFLLVPPNVPGSIVITLREGEAKTDLQKGAEQSVLEVSTSGIGALAMEDEAGGLEVIGDLVDIWKRAGYAQLADVMALDLRLLRELISGEISLDITQALFNVTACADSLATFGVIATDFAKLFPNKKVVEPYVKTPMMADSINVFGSVDENAFNHMPEIVSHGDADMIDDDLPHNLDYLDRATRVSKDRPTHDRSTGESLRAWHTTGEEGEDVERDNGEGGETVRVFGDAIEEENYWEELPVISDGYSANQSLGKTRVRVHDATVKILLHDGYDWPRTRKAIEDEVRAVRRRLERIRQLLASGQKADESIERATSSVLFNSVYIGLEQRAEMNLSSVGMGKMDERALMAAIDEELNELETESGSSWQTLPGNGNGTSAGAGAINQPSKKTRFKGKRLTRSKKPQIEITLSGVKADIDVFSPDDSTSSRVHLSAKEMEILDHIKTSTWKKFLTEMKSDSGGNIRETDADMVRIELIGVRLKEGEEELRLKAKILPLRLHVDQDALDFLKRFFNFKAATHSSSPPPDHPSPLTPGPYFQHVEIFPIHLKLDYKPKRVDFKALREGKTMELMNFFHFDGAEMTLRYVTMSGIMGLEKLGETLQDLWTPDVKANQLADVISGVSPIRSMVNVGSGVADLILLPIEQYRKDGRVAKGVQRGANSFVKSTALEMMKLGARLATGTQVILERAEGMIGGKAGEEVVGHVQGSFLNGPLSESAIFEGGSSSEDEEDLVSRYANQPEGVREGVQAAYTSFSKNVNAAAQTILAVPMEIYERSGDSGPFKAVVRAVPIAVLKPMIGTTEAVSKTLLGMRNSLDPSARQGLGDKYK